MNTICYELTDGIATVTFDEPDSPVNTMCRQWQHDLSALVDQVIADKDGIKGILLTSAKATFFAGADLKGVMRLKPSDAQAVFTEVELIKKNFRTLETLGKPVVSCLNGTALGGGWEVALIGHHRIAIDEPKTRFGLPEVTLGLLPGASGVTKMTRHLGLAAAHPFLVEGKTFSPQQAQTMGLVHTLIAPSATAESDMRALALAWIAANPNAQHPWEAKDYKVPGGLPAAPKVASLLTVAPAMLKKQTRGLYPAPEAILACMVEGLQVDVPTALRIESRYLARLMTGMNARAMINTFFFDMNVVKNRKERGGAATGGALVDTETLDRIKHAYIAEGAAMLSEGISPAMIENAGLQCGMASGPLRAGATAAEPAPLPGFAILSNSPQDITDLKDRLLYRQAIEAARCLNEKCFATVADANIGSIFALGFPAWTGGVLQFIYGMGQDAFEQRASKLANQFGAGFALADDVKAALRSHQPVY